MHPADPETRRRPNAIVSYAPASRLPGRSMLAEDARPKARRPVLSTLLGVLAVLGIASTVLSLAP